MIGIRIYHCLTGIDHGSTGCTMVLHPVSMALPGFTIFEIGAIMVSLRFTMVLPFL